jgi:hypothetical protein
MAHYQMKPLRRALASSVAAALFGVFFSSRSSFASNMSQAAGIHAIQPLLTALRATQLPVCVEAAERLYASFAHTHAADLALRSAKLDSAHALALAAAIRHATQGGAFQLRGFSASYNPQIGSTGAAAIVAAMPDNLAEFGLVGCALDDVAGDAIVEFMARATKLRVICVEENTFSTAMVARITQAGRLLPGCLVVV